MTSTLAEPLTLPCGAVLSNRLCKAAMTEGLADPLNRATERHVHLYDRWGRNGAGLLLTGNVQVDRRYLERPGNVAYDGNDGLDTLAAFARAGTAGGAQLWMQLGHAGRQTPRKVSDHPVAPSAVPLALPAEAFAPPRALEGWEVAEIPARFARVAAAAREAGFTGVQLHAAHGYLLSEFLSPLANRRDDEWGGPLENRARLLLDSVRAVRAAVGPAFPVAVKLNSSDFQKGGFTHAECLRVVEWLGEAGIDLLEISGGNYEQPALLGKGGEDDSTPVKPSTRAREAYFLDYAANIRSVARMPLMVTGGFRTRAGMERALADGACDVIGIARPMCVEWDLPIRLLDGSAEGATAFERIVEPSKAQMAWFYWQLFRMGDGLDPDPEVPGDEGARQFRRRERDVAAALRRAPAGG